MQKLVKKNSSDLPQPGLPYMQPQKLDINLAQDIQRKLSKLGSQASVGTHHESSYTSISNVPMLSGSNKDIKDMIKTQNLDINKI